MSHVSTGALRRFAAGLALATGLAVGGTALAGDPPPAPTNAPVTSTTPPTTTAAVKDPDHADTELNDRIAAANEAAAQREEDNRRAFEAAQQRYLDAVNQRLNDEVRRQAEYARAMDAWRADVAACQAGDTSRCAPVQPQPPASPPPAASPTSPAR